MCSKGQYRQSKKDNEWTFTITTQDITASAGVTVTQMVSGDVVTGTLNTALTGANTKTMVVANTTGGSFITTTDVVIGTGGTAITIAHSTITNAGKITPTDPTKCIVCPAGWKSDEDGSTLCVRCEAGTFSSRAVGFYCTECEAGQYRPSKKEDEWTLDIGCRSGTSNDGCNKTKVISNNVAAGAGVIFQTVSGDVVTGTIKTVLNNTKLVIKTTFCSFVDYTDIVIETGSTAITAYLVDAKKKTLTDPTLCTL